MRLITSTDIMGHMARWAVQLHPYHEPHGLFGMCKVIQARAESEFKDGVFDLPMRWFADSQDLRRWLHEILDGHVVLREWNRPRSGHTAPFVSSSRFHGPAPEDDFIDIDALILNITNSAWDGAEESDDRPRAPLPPLSGDLTASHALRGPMHVEADWPGYG